MNKTNPVIKSALQYHRYTSYQRHQMTPHYLDWQNQPLLYKSYPGMDPVLLPRHAPTSGEKFYSVLSKTDVKNKTQEVSMEDLSLVLQMTYTLTAKARHPGGNFFYRSVASAGALYPTEIYVAVQQVKGLEDGLYHFSISHHGLFRLRKGALDKSMVMTTTMANRRVPVLTFFLTAIFFRSSWKYRDRAYRYHLLDTGHVAENLILSIKAIGLPYMLFYDFDDIGVNRLLGLDETKEVCLSMCRIPGTQAYHEEKTEEILELPEFIKGASRVAEKETDYPVIRHIHNAGNTIISNPESTPDMIFKLGIAPDKWTAINPPEAWPESLSYTEAVFNRRSKRNFVRKPILQNSLAALLDCICIDVLKMNGDTNKEEHAVCTGLFIGSAEKFEPGLYLLDVSSKSIGIIVRDFFMERMARICLDQGWLASAAVHFLFMTNLNNVEKLWGARGYRYAMLTAGRLGERLYLAATAMGLGCCGIGAFYDKEASDLIGLNTNSRLLYLVAVGPVKS